MKKVRDMRISKRIAVSELVEKMKESGGFTAKKLGDAAEILKLMIKDCSLRFLSFPACIVASGTRGVIKDMVKAKWFDVIITTCGTLDHDLARSFKNYYHGKFELDDARLHERGVHRLGNVLVPRESYGIVIEKKLRPWLREIYAEHKELASYELCWEIGKRLNESSILYWAWKNKLPVIVPGITDGAVGYQLWQFYQTHRDFKIDVLKDEQLLSDLIWNSKRLGALILGGGISKHHTIWWAQFGRGLDYAVYITTAVEWDGSLSGARMREAVSWGKIKSRAKYITVEGDVTILLPVLYASVLRRVC